MATIPPLLMSPCVRPPTNTARMQRGAACSCCRQKKTKCDGLRPCSRCAKLKRGDECAYDDESLPDPQEPLEVKMQQLETRLWNLESTQTPISYPARPLPPSPCISKPAAPLMQSQELFSSLPGYPTAVAPDSNSPIILGPKQSDTDLELQTAFLFDAFFHHRFRIGWNFHADPSCLYAWVLDPTQSRGPHPSLLYAIRLVSLTYYPQWASDPGYFLTRAMEAAALGIVTADDRILHIIQASCLLATYFYSRNRIQEGYFHSSTAARLASSRLLAFSSPKVRDNWPEEFATLSQVLAVDRAWSVTSGLPSALNDCDLWVGPGSSPVSPWSVSDLQEYVNTVEGFRADELFAANPNTLWNKVLTLRTGACIAYEMSYRLSTNHRDDTEFQSNRGYMESALQSFKTIIPAFCRRSGAQIEPLDLQLVVIHTFVHTSCLHLERNSIVDSPESRKNCLVAVESITTIIQQLTEADFRNLDAILSSCWLGAAYICLHLITLSLPLKVTSLIQMYLNHLLYATKELGKTFPLADLHARQMEFSWIWMTVHSSTVSSSVAHRSL